MQNRARNTRIGREEAEGIFDLEEVSVGEVLAWPLAPDYKIAPGGWLTPEPGRDQSFRAVNQLSDTGLYVSFARLARGRRSKEHVRRWVSAHGLLTRKEPEQGSATMVDGFVNQAPLRVDDLLDLARGFGGLLELYAEIQASDVEAIASRIESRASVIDEHLASELAAWAPGRPDAPLGLLGEWISSYAAHPLLWLADKVLCDEVGKGASGVRLRPVSGFAIPWEMERKERSKVRERWFRPYVPSVSYSCPDLLSALYLQLLMVISRRRPVRRCKGCGLPLPETFPKNKHHHNQTCRSNARHERKRRT